MKVDLIRLAALDVLIDDPDSEDAAKILCRNALRTGLQESDFDKQLEILLGRKISEKINVNLFLNFYFTDNNCYVSVRNRPGTGAVNDKLIDDIIIYKGLPVKDKQKRETFMKLICKTADETFFKYVKYHVDPKFIHVDKIADPEGTVKGTNYFLDFTSEFRNLKELVKNGMVETWEKENLLENL